MSKINNAIRKVMLEKEILLLCSVDECKLRDCFKALYGHYPKKNEVEETIINLIVLLKTLN